MTDQQELDLNELNEALKNIDNGDDNDPPKKDNKGEPEQTEQSKETTNEETKEGTTNDEKRKVDIETVYELINKMKNEDNQSNTKKKQSKQKKPKTEKQQKQFEDLQRKREEKREQERKEREKQKLLQEIDIDSIVNKKLERILSQYEQEQQPQYQPSTVEPQAAPVDEKPAYPYNHLTTKPEKPSKPPSLFNQLGLNTSTPQKSRQPKQPAVKENPQSGVNPFNFFKKA